MTEKTRDEHVNGITDRLYHTDMNEYEKQRDAAAKDAANAEISTWKATTKSGQTFTFEARADAKDDLLRWKADRVRPLSVPSSDAYVSFERV